MHIIFGYMTRVSCSGAAADHVCIGAGAEHDDDDNWGNELNCKKSLDEESVLEMQGFALAQADACFPFIPFIVIEITQLDLHPTIVPQLPLSFLVLLLLLLVIIILL
ncbi:hypothetical protein MUK42_13154 [Musa troglodytarum]|uniref:Uncharacterized protein n=1 Tax=Musa troglodytarum TaxID=320322 RepID=A0A9E7L0S1_9LILI|nr:hypothetical protein MUK42_13154 [Musa troglodytarum]